MRVLGIETSCDETGLAIVEVSGNNSFEIKGQALYSQIAMHQNYGGVVPELASRDHIKRIIPLINQVVKDSGADLQSIDAIAYTQGPGLAGALLVGTSVAKALGMALGIPTIGIHHLEGHLLSPLLGQKNPLEFPFIALLVSGGHTQLMLVKGLGQYIILGETLDDAAGEAFDKTAKLLGLPYPGGPQVSALAESGQSERFNFPRPMLHSKDLDFSFAGLKTAVLTQVKKLGGTENLEPSAKADIAASFVAAITEVITEKCIAALKTHEQQHLIVAGGVGANVQLREHLNH
ncbi:MAG: putative tRNA threonylcarbamoyladenosine biosynthesis protein Gcp, partial [Pseudomonadota bacterium]